MKKFLQIIILGIALLFVGKESFATHVAGGEFRYECVGPDAYRVQLIMYRDCDGVGLGGSQSVSITSSCGNFVETLNRVSVTEVSGLCPSALSQSTCNSGALPGLEEHVYEAIVTLPQCNTGLYTITYGPGNGICCRNRAANLQNRVNANGANQQFSTEIRNDATVNCFTGSFNSPVFEAQPTPYVCVNQQVDFNLNISDSDNDSLAISIVNPRPQTGGFNASYVSPYSVTNPFDVPVNFNNQTGQVSFVPNTFMANEEGGIWVLAIEVTEFRNGQKIGAVTRDFQFVVLNCPNSSPVAPASFTNFSGTADSTGTNNVVMYPGMDFCMDITFSDPDPGDILTLSTNLSSVLPGAQLNVTGTNPLTANICWTATAADVGSKAFALTVNDSACPTFATASFGVNVQVLPCTGLFGLLTQEDVSCAGSCDGLIKVEMFCGSGDYSYAWVNGNPPGNPTASDSQRVCAATNQYRLEVTDNVTSETWLSGNIRIAEPLIIEIDDFTITNDDCDSNTCSGAISLNTVSGGTGAGTYSFDWSNAATGTNLTGLCEGDYTVTITDGNGCTLERTFDVLEPAQISASLVSANDPLCLGDNNGSIVVQGTSDCGVTGADCGGAANTATIGTGTSAFSGNSYPALYGADLRGAKNQMLYTASELQAEGVEPGPIESLAFDVTGAVSFSNSFEQFEIKISCVTESDLTGGWAENLSTVFGPQTITVSSGWNFYTLDNAFNWDGQSNILVEICYTNPNPGIGGLTNNTHVNMSPTPVDRYRFQNENSDTVCTSPGSGSTIGIRPNIRFEYCQSNFNYTWSPAPAAGQTSDSVSGLPAGSYVVTVTSDDGCVDTLEVTLNNPPPFDIDSVSLLTPILCGGDSNARAEVFVTGGVPPLSYNWSTGDTTPVAENLPAGIHVVTVIDSGGCEIVDSIEIIEPDPLSGLILPTNPISCFDTCDGQLTIFPTGGTPGFSYDWIAGVTGTDSVQSNLCAGTYEAVVTDSRGCTDTASFDFLQPDSIEITVSILQQVSCFGVCDAIIEASATGGDGDFDFFWNVANGDSAVKSGICGDSTYIVTVVDGNGCTDTAHLFVPQPDPIVTDAQNVSDASCNGVCDGEGTISVVSGGTPGFTFDWTNTISGANPTNLCAGTYEITITDDNNCTTLDTVEINEPDSIDIQITLDEGIDCFGDCTGELTASATGGDGNFTYTWINTLTATGANQTGLCADVYTVVATDGNGCTDTADFEITQPTQLDGNIFVQNPVSCFDSCDAEIRAEPTGGTPSYSYTWIAGTTGTDSVQTGLCAGTYEVEVQDANNCLDTLSITLGQPDSIELTVSVTQGVSCFGVCDATIEASATGGSGGFTFSWNTGGGTSATETGVCGGTTYIVTATDASGCTDTAHLFVPQPDEIVFNTTVLQDASCNALCDGVAAAEVISGGTPGFTFDWTSSISGDTVSTLCAGDYEVTVTDANGCTATDSVTIDQPSLLEVAINIDQGVLCAGDLTGELTAIPTGGAGNYQFEWQTTPLQTTATISNLGAGSYTVEVIDDSNCIATASVNLTEPAPLNAGINVLQSINCGGDCDGELEAFGTGGTAPLTFNWFAGVTGSDQNQDSLCGSITGIDYSVEVVDSNNCTDTATVTLTEPEVLEITSFDTVNPITCFDNCDGEIEALVTGGTRPYVYNWTNAAGDSVITGLCADVYVLNIQDDNGCATTDSAELTQPDSIEITANIISNVSCGGGCDGEAEILVSGGIQPYNISWPGALTGAVQNNLCAGEYTVTVTDSNNCVDSVTFLLSEPTAITATLDTEVNPTCFGDCNGELEVSLSGGTAPLSLLWSTGDTTNAIDSLCADTFTLIVNDAAACADTFEYVLTEPDSIDWNINLLQAPSCAGFCNGEAQAVVITGGTGWKFIQWSNGDTGLVADSVCPGTLEAYLSDANGCTDTLDLSVPNPSPFTASLDNSTNVTCPGGNDGTAEITVANPTPDVTFNWTPAPGAGQGTAIGTGLTAGAYSVQVIDTVTGCLDEVNFTIDEPDSFDFQFNVINAISCFGVCDGEVEVSVTGGTGNPAGFSYAWSGGLTGTVQSGLCADSFTVTVTDSLNCTAQGGFTLSQPDSIGNLAVTTDVTCFGDTDGTAQMNVQGGTPPFTYTWSTGDSTAFVGNLASGPVLVTITDSTGCTFEDSLFIGTPPQINFSGNIDVQPSCAGACDGEISTSFSGGVGGQTYTWSDGGFGPNRTNLCAGPYSVTVTDTNGCADSLSFILVDPPAITASIITNQAVSCNGACDGELEVDAQGGAGSFTYLWSNAVADSVNPGLCAGSYTVTVTDAAGCFIEVSDTLTEPDSITATPVITDAGCGVCDGEIDISNVQNNQGALTYNWDIVPNPGNVAIVDSLCAGTYSVTITDSNNCEWVDSTLSISNLGGADSAELSLVHPTCAGDCDGEITATPFGGVAPFTYAWSTGNPDDTNATVTDLCAGVYTVTIEDSAGCVIIETDSLIDGTRPEISVDVTQISCFGDCDGEIEINLISGVPPITYSWTDGSTDSVRSNLCSGRYGYEVTDSNGCSVIDTVVISEPDSLFATFDSLPASCFNSCDGTGVANITGGTAPFTVDWTASGVTGDSVNTLCAGINPVVVTDSNGCTFNDTISIAAPDSIVIDSVILEDTDCGVSSGGIIISASGGAGALNISWNGGAFIGDTLSGLPAGTYVVEITDSNNCTLVDSFQINELGAPSLQLVGKDITCHGDCDGAVASVVSPAGNYNYTWNTGATTANLNNLCPGNYELTVTDSAGCTASASVVLSQPDSISIDSIVQTAPGCGDSNGVLQVFVSGGSDSANLTAVWNGTDSGLVLTNIPGGSYTVEVFDTSGCSVSRTVNLGSDSTFNLNTSATSPRCAGDCDGQAFVSVAPPATAGPFRIQWSTSAADSLNTLTGLCAGTYNVVVTDSASGCVASASVDVVDPDPIIIDSILTVEPGCGDNNGSLEAFASGGTDTLNYQWTGGPSTPFYGNLAAGFYTLEVTDNNGCSITETLPLGNDQGPDIELTGNDASCNGDCTGSASVSILSGPEALFNIVWSTGDMTADISGLCEGTYAVSVEDTNGCVTVDTVQIDRNGALDLDLIVTDNAGCADTCDGSIEVVVSGGNAPFAYNWNIAGAGNVERVENLCEGTYSVEVDAAGGCSGFAAAVIESVPEMEVAVDSVFQPNCAVSNDGFISLNVTGGTAPYSYRWRGPGGFSSTAESLNNIFPGTYRVTVEDAGFCSQILEIELRDTTQLSVVGFDTTICGSAFDVLLRMEVESNFSVEHEWRRLNGFTLDTGNTIVIDTVNQTVRYLAVAKSNGCEVVDTVTVRVRPQPEINIGNDTTLVVNTRNQLGRIPITNVEGATFEWTPDDGTLSNASVANPFVTPTGPTTYRLTITDIFGCSVTDSIVINTARFFDFPDGLSPNGDGVNDDWELDFLRGYPNAKVQVFSRWGQKVYEGDGVTEPFDGRYNGSDLPVGTYYYVIDLNDGGDSKPLTGPVTIIR